MRPLRARVRPAPLVRRQLALGFQPVDELLVRVPRPPITPGNRHRLGLARLDGSLRAQTRAQPRARPSTDPAPLRGLWTACGNGGGEYGFATLYAAETCPGRGPRRGATAARKSSDGGHGPLPLRKILSVGSFWWCFVLPGGTRAARSACRGVSPPGGSGIPPGPTALRGGPVRGGPELGSAPTRSIDDSTVVALRDLDPRWPMEPRVGPNSPVGLHEDVGAPTIPPG